MSTPHSVVGREDGEQWMWAPNAASTSSSLVPTRAQILYLERDIMDHLASGTEKSLTRAIASDRVGRLGSGYE
jgi:hypothetical protein